MVYWLVENNQPVKTIQSSGDYRPDPNGPTYPNPSKMSAQEREALGIYPENKPSPPDGVWYTYTTSKTFLNGEVVFSYSNITPKDITGLKELKKAEAASKRYAIEVGGITVSSIPIATDRDSQAMYIAARILAKEDVNYTINWKTETGFVTLDATTIIAVADAVRQHVQDAFDWEAAHITAIDALTEAQDVINYEVV